MPYVNIDTSILQAALEGLERRREQLEEQIRSVRSLIDGARLGRARKPESDANGQMAEPRPARKKRGISAAGRKRLAELMRERWAAKRTAAQAKPARKSKR
jgi:hypothetical protein